MTERKISEENLREAKALSKKLCMTLDKYWSAGMYKDSNDAVVAIILEALQSRTDRYDALKKQAEELAETLKQIYEAAKPYDGESLTTSFIVEKAKYTLEAYRKDKNGH